MTEKLKDLLHHRAESVDFVAPDVDAMTRAGDRTRTRRRAAVVGGAAAAVVAATLAVTALPGLGGDDSPGPAAEATPGMPALTWVSGHTLHAPDLPGGEVDLGHEVRAYVRTHDGFVLADPDGHVWSWVDGTGTEVGSVDGRSPHLVSDPTGQLAGWLDPGAGNPAYVVLDLATGETTTYDDQAAGEGDPVGPGSSPYFYAIDGHTAYWRDARGAVATDLDSGDTTVVDAPAGRDLDINAVHDDLVAFNSEDGTTVGTSPADALRLKGSFGGRGSFSPDGRYFSEDADEPKVWDMTTGEPVDLDLQYNFASGYGWTDDGDLLLLGQDGWQDDVEIVRCHVPAGDCETVAPGLGTFKQLSKSGFSLPVGSRVGG